MHIFLFYLNEIRLIRIKSKREFLLTWLCHCLDWHILFICHEAQDGEDGKSRHKTRATVQTAQHEAIPANTQQMQKCSPLFRLSALNHSGLKWSKIWTNKNKIDFISKRTQKDKARDGWMQDNFQISKSEWLKKVREAASKPMKERQNRQLWESLWEGLYAIPAEE